MREQDRLTTGEASAGAAPVARAALSLTAIVMATTMVALDATIVTVALPSISNSLGAARGVEWVVTVYLLAVAATQPATGWLANRYGRSTVFRTSTAMFTIASLGCAMAPNLAVLLVLRTLQGLGGGAIFPVGMAMVFELFPREQHGRAVSTWATALMVSPALGPTIGGWLVTALSWHWLFTINLPIGLCALLLSRVALPRDPRSEAESLDVAGLVMGAVGLTLIVLGVSESNGWGWTSSATASTVIIGGVLLVAFARRQLHSENPVLELALLRTRDVRDMITLLFILQIANFARLVFIPLELADVRGYSALQIGLVLMPGAVFAAVCMKLGGRQIDSVGLRRPAVIGVIMMLAGSLVLATIGPTTPVAVIVFGLCLHGGYAFAYAANAVVGMSDLPARSLAQAAALRNVGVQVGGAISVGVFTAVSAAVIGSATDPSRVQRGYDVIFLVSAVMLIPALALVRRFPTRVGANATPPLGVVIE